MDKPRKVAILGGNRIPFARSNTAYARLSNYDLLSAALDGLVQRFGLEGERMGEMAGGAVLKHARDWNLVREVVLGSKLAPETPAYDLQQACATGLECVVNVGNKIALGQIDCAIAGGSDTTSDAPIAVSRKLQQAMMAFNRAKTRKAQLSAFLKMAHPSNLLPEIPRNSEPRTGLSMGQHCELTSQHWGITREAQDELAYESHRKLAAAYDSGFFDDLMTPCHGLKRDNNLRPDVSMEKMASLPPAFDKEKGTLSAANSSPLSDGASAVLLSTDEWAAAHGFPVLAHLVDAEVAAVDFRNEHEGLLMAPAYAVPRLLVRNKLTLEDFDFYEIHEAFAAQVLGMFKAWEDPEYCKTRLGLKKPFGTIDRARLNVNGGSIAVGHPFAATGGRITASLAKMLAQKGSGRGLISICAAGGQGITAIIER
ncbi:MAG: acetyl-CoA C-acetyltransferase [Nevskiaceae bacterium]|nr:MAG: acetyl-CoA C-acetyltransferase [Nevskiaceae bacterium]TBR74185.1 MAG: acetyl-CoA C-acetyltransferase [Nevskiaceae bacterium]